MPSKRYTVIVADRETGEVRRVTVAVRPAATALAILALLPAIGLGVSRWDANTEINRLRAENARLHVESASYRSGAADLAGQIGSLQTAIDRLTARAGMDEPVQRLIDRLPATVDFEIPATPAPGPTFDRIKTVLDSLDRELSGIRHSVALRETLAGATPTIWPADGWISSGYGYRSDPFTGEREFHSALDISTRSGEPVHATASGLVAAAHRQGNYGNMVEIRHGFDLTTRYGHLSSFAVGVGDTVERGDIIGYAGATGRATGYHVHYEVAVNGQNINPLRLLTETDPISAN